jgi:hypothetical protein
MVCSSRHSWAHLLYSPLPLVIELRKGGNRCRICQISHSFSTTCNLQNGLDWFQLSYKGREAGELLLQLTYYSHVSSNIIFTAHMSFSFMSCHTLQQILPLHGTPLNSFLQQQKTFDSCMNNRTPSTQHTSQTGQTQHLQLAWAHVALFTPSRRPRSQRKSQRSVTAMSMRVQSTSPQSSLSQQPLRFPWWPL